jgi:hypothetical protein
MLQSIESRKSVFVASELVTLLNDHVCMYNHALNGELPEINPVDVLMTIGFLYGEAMSVMQALAHPVKHEKTNGLRVPKGESPEEYKRRGKAAKSFVRMLKQQAEVKADACISGQPFPMDKRNPVLSETGLEIF